MAQNGHNGQNTQNYHTFMLFVQEPQDEHDLSGIVVPQRVYVPPTPTPPHLLLPPVRFMVNGRVGVRLTDALNPAFTGLEHRTHTPRMSHTAVRVTLRIWWPGYDQWSVNMPICDNTAATNPFNMLGIARRVATVVQEFYGNMQDVQPNAPDQATFDWRIRNIPFDSLYLAELRHVSQGSWQPVLCFRANN